MAKTKKFAKTIGSRAEVFHGVAERTGYGVNALKKKDLVKNKHGRIVSKKKHRTAKKEKRLEKHGFFATKGKFGFVKKSPSKSKKSRTMKKKGKK
tara:strand:- start:595 stop:879 length:285 start_codon:yes stop_codon:yes gene_type:complete